MFGAWGETDHDKSIAIIHRALDAGINFIDTADVYSRGESEEIVGKALAGGRRDDVILATKVHGTMGDDPNEFGNSRRWIVREVENSLRRLGTDWIDLYQIHRPEQDTDIDETLGALTDLVRAGQGPLHRVVDVPGQPDRGGPVGRRAARARALRLRAAALLDAGARDRGATCCPRCVRHRMGAIAWSPLAGGWLSGKWRKGADDLSSRRSAMIPRALRPLDPGQPAQARRRRRARPAGRRGRHHADRDGARVRDPPPGGHRRDHRPAHDGAPRVAARRRRRRADRRRARPHRRDRAARRRTSTPPTAAGRTPRSSPAALRR